jgi:precorrin-6Y C5,15-methyltransferase (decarboxylating)
MRWQGPPLQVIGMGVFPDSALSPAARAALAEAELVIGAERQRVWLDIAEARFRAYPKPFSALTELIQAQQGRRLALLASGDPLFYGLGDWLIRHVGRDKLVFHPHVSSVQAAFARIGEPWQDAEVVSLHGRALPRLRSRLHANRLYALLTDADSHPAAIAAELEQAGFADSDVWVAEALGSERERVRAFSVGELIARPPEVDPLHVTLVRTRGPGGVLPEFPGIPDDHFATGTEPGRGLLTKREVRLTALSLLQPRAGEIGWDIGAGCGGVAVEWARWNRLGQVYAVEQHAERFALLQQNRDRFGVDGNLHCVHGRAPDALAALPDPQAVFVGGSGGGLLDLLHYCWQRLAGGGRLVASAVTEPSRMALYQFADDKQAAWHEVAVSRGETLAGQLLLRPQLPVLLMQVSK